MFMDESQFDDVEEIRITSKFGKLRQHQHYLVYLDISINIIIFLSNYS